MEKTLLIDQPAGLGDIFFCQKIANEYHRQGYKITWPIKESIKWVIDYLENESNINYTTDNQNPINFDLYLKLDKSSPDGKNVMLSKYKVANLTSENWIDFLKFKRNKEKENQLFYDVLKLKDNEKYTFINNIFATPPEIQYYPIEENNQEKNIRLQIIKGFTIFEWLKVIENANKIKTIETCFHYLIEKIDLKTDDLTAYCRWGEYTYNEVNFLFHKKWKYKW